jgi:hypothetical protein
MSHIVSCSPTPLLAPGSFVPRFPSPDVCAELRGPASSVYECVPRANSVRHRSELVELDCPPYQFSPSRRKSIPTMAHLVFVSLQKMATVIDTADAESFHKHTAPAITLSQNFVAVCLNRLYRNRCIRIRTERGPTSGPAPISPITV